MIVFLYIASGKAWVHETISFKCPSDAAFGSHLAFIKATKIRFPVHEF
jgi:hypothetical protein